MATYFNPNTTVESKAQDPSVIPIKDGQFLMATDTGSLFYDAVNKRIQFMDIIKLDTEAQRIALVAPIDKFYFVKESATLWKFVDGEWKNWPNGGSGGGVGSYVKTFTAADWSGEKIIIPVSEHKLNIQNGFVGSNVYALVDGTYTNQVFAAMDTEVSVGADNSVILSTPGSGYAGQVVLYC